MKEAQKNIIDLVNKFEHRNSEQEPEEEAFGSSFMKDRAYIDDDDENIQYPGMEN